MGFKKKLAAGVSVTLLGSTGAIVGHSYYYNQVPDLAAIEALPHDQMPDVVPAGGTPNLMCSATIPDCTVETSLAYTKTTNYKPLGSMAVAPAMYDAAVAREDGRYWGRPYALDARGLTRAGAHDIRHGIPAIIRGESWTKQGGSTIEMQLAEMRYGLSGRPTMNDKIYEARVARRMWQETPGNSLYEKKKHNLNLYLDYVYFGRGATGIVAATETYFDKTPDQLDELEASMLAGRPSEPSNEATLEENQTEVLDAMASIGFLNEKKAADLKDRTKHPVSQYLKPRRPDSEGTTVAGFYVRQGASIGAEHYIQEVVEAFNERKTEIEKEHQQRGTKPPELDLKKDIGLKIITSLNTTNQKIAHEVTRSTSLDSGERIALTQVGPDGAVLAMIGGDFKESQFNLATAMRPTGSTMKPFWVATAIKNGASTSQRYVVPEKLEISLPNGQTWPVKSEAYCPSGCDMKEALARSVNGYFALDVTNPKHDYDVHDMQELAHDLGMPFKDQYEASVLGAVESSTLGVAQAYNSLLRNQGKATPHHFIQKITDASSQTLYEHQLSEGKQVISQEIAKQVIKLSRGPVQAGGTADEVVTLDSKDIYVAGKTGTTERGSDAWFAGTTYSQGTIVVRIGHIASLARTKNSGGKLPAQTFNRIMLRLPQDATHSLDDSQ